MTDRTEELAQALIDYGLDPGWNEVFIDMDALTRAILASPVIAKIEREAERRPMRTLPFM